MIVFAPQSYNQTSRCKRCICPNAYFDTTKDQTLSYTNGKQLSQYKIKINKPRSITITPTSAPKIQAANATIENIWIEHNKLHNDVKCMEIHTKLTTHYMDDEGGRLVALFDSLKGMVLRDVNNNYRTVDGQVSVGTDFGSHYEHAKYPDIVLIIPNMEIHAVRGQKYYFIRLGVYDYHQKKYIQFSDYVNSLCHFDTNRMIGTFSTSNEPSCGI